MIGRVTLLVLISVLCKGDKEGVVIFSLGGAEERAMTSSLSSLLSWAGHHVTLVTYGGIISRPSSEVFDIPVAIEDYLYASTAGQRNYIVPSLREHGLFDVITARDSEPANQSEGVDEPANQNEGVYPPANQNPASYEEVVTSSTRLACKQMLPNTDAIKGEISRRAKIILTPLHFHDLCTLTLAADLDLPVVGLVTSPTGSWWTWYHLDLVPSLAISAVPMRNISREFGFIERVWNIWDFYAYLRKMNSLWAEPLMTSLPAGTFKPISELYSRVGAVVVAYDWLIDPDLPVTPFVTSMAGARWGDDPELDKDILGPLQANRNGAILVSLKMAELWVGVEAQDAILTALSATPFTVIWRGVGKARGGVGKGNNTGGGAPAGRTSAILVQKEELPIRSLLGHPRHRVLVSLCGFSEAGLAVAYGSPLLCVPMTDDQRVTGDRLADKGLAIVVPAAEVTISTIREAIRNLTTIRSFRARGRELAEEHLDSPLPAADHVLYTIRKLLRRPWRFRRRQTHGLSLLVQSNGDVIAAILILVTSLGAGVIYGVVLVAMRIWNTEKTEKKKKEE